MVTPKKRAARVLRIFRVLRGLRATKHLAGLVLRQRTQNTVLAASAVALMLVGMAPLHLPNFALMVFTFAAGSAWARSGLRHGALLPLALSHWLLGTLVVLSAPAWLLRSAEIGARFLLPSG